MSTNMMASGTRWVSFCCCCFLFVENVNAERDQTEGYYSRTAEHNALIAKTNAHLRVQQFGIGLQRCVKVTCQMSHPSPYVRTPRERYNAQPLQWGGPVPLLCCGGNLLAWFWSTESEGPPQINTELFWVITVDETSNQEFLMSGLIQDDNAPHP